MSGLKLQQGEPNDPGTYLAYVQGETEGLAERKVLLWLGGQWRNGSAINRGGVFEGEVIGFIGPIPPSSIAGIETWQASAYRDKVLTVKRLEQQLEEAEAKDFTKQVEGLRYLPAQCTKDSKARHSFKLIRPGMYDDTMQCTHCSFQYSHSIDAPASENKRRATHECDRYKHL